mmetsp:Transcript_17055/g.23870  ORF Transcript_17055/g.23870 Transcript_17055/m.23870 type:complete len:461 (+) Transcript_17055:99-1481(+)|eukprot:CAMPEP_0184487988 /NCGR_PEP_ID=MMETSP0113_2-20130426/10460_1 /TAXON_ID=91329 /ORGANISM="Norrisiella sphaerica, Strain BC52" /LENGTH=460 /DNA_ID=CAMNT_0026870445 /DNA_START=99 /DNA_END=1481 /DNA_ORIENTATION=-
MSGWNIRNWLTASAAAVGTLATVKLMMDYRKWNEMLKQRKARTEEKKRRRKKADPLMQKGLPSDQQLLFASFTALQKMQKQEGGESVNYDRQLIRWLRSMSKDDINMYKPKTRLLSAQFLELFYINRCAQARSPESYRAMVEGHRTELEIAWQLLQCRPEEASEEMAVRLLALKIAKRLKDRNRMLPIFDNIIERMKSPESIVIPEAFAAFTVAPILGRWEATRQLAVFCVANGVRLDDLHNMAQDNPDVPDLKVLSELAEKKLPDLTSKDVSIEHIRWTEYLIKGLRIKLCSVECEDDQRRREWQENFKTQIDSFSEIDIPSETKIIRTGAIAQMLSFSRHPILMVGPASDSKMYARGFAVTTGGRRSEEIQIEKKGNKDSGSSEIWSGKYLCIQEDLPTVTINVDIEMTLEERKFQQEEGKFQSKVEKKSEGFSDEKHAPQEAEIKHDDFDDEEDALD